jgi:hypothetical protein
LFVFIFGFAFVFAPVLSYLALCCLVFYWLEGVGIEREIEIRNRK